MEVIMKQFLGGLLAMCATVSLQGMQAELKKPLLGDQELTEVVVDDAAGVGADMAPEMPATPPPHAPGTQSADNTPEKAVVESPEVVVDMEALLADPSLTPALKEILKMHEKGIRDNGEKIAQIFDIVKQLREADEEHSLPKKQRIIASATELGCLTTVMMVYTYFLDREGYNTAAIVQHYAAQSWLRNFNDANPLIKVIIALMVAGAGQVLDFRVIIPLLGHPLGLAPLTTFFAIGTILQTVATVNPISKTKETVCGAVRKVRIWLGRNRNPDGQPGTSTNV